jgi:hypothetical protein
MYRKENVTIHEITVFGGRNEILVRGTQHRDHLNYESSWYINTHELNRLMNELQRLNSHLYITDVFTSYTSTEGSIFQLEGNKLTERKVNAGWLEQSPVAREIRA